MPFIPPFHFTEHLLLPWSGPLAADTAWTVLMGWLVAVACSWLGCYLILQGMALIGDAISHTVLLGIVAAFLLTGQVTGGAMFVGAAVTGLLTTLLIEALHRNSRLKEDAAIGIVFTSLFALGVVLLSTLAGGAHIDTQHMLYGDISLALLDESTVAGFRVPTAVCQMAVVVLLLFVLIVAFYKELLVVAFDRQLAACLGMHPRLVQYGMMTVLSIVIVGSFTSVGAILVVAMLIAPAATAYLLTHRLWQMFAWCVVVGGLSSLIGFHLAYWLSVSTGGAMSCAACGLFGVAFLFSPSQGLLAVAWRRARLRTRMTVENAVRALLKVTSDPQPVPFTIRDLAGHLQTSVWRLRWVLKLLRRRGWIEFDPELPLGIRLTATGQGVAHRLDRTHRLWEKYLVEQVGLPSDHVHTTAEEVEHLLSEKFVERVDDLLGHPDLDPHGSPIPRSPISDLAPGVFTLSKLRVGDRGRIVGLAVPLGAAGEALAPQSPTDRPPGSPVTEPEPTADSIAALGLPLGQPFTVIKRDAGEHSWTIEALPGQPIVLPHRLADLLLVQPENER